MLIIKNYGKEKTRMAFIEKLKTSIQEKRAAERMAAKLEQQSALLDYVAIMTDVELPVEESEGTAYEPQ